MKALLAKVSHVMLGCAWGNATFQSIPGFGADGPCLSAGTQRIVFTSGGRPLPGYVLLCPEHADATGTLVDACNADRGLA